MKSQQSGQRTVRNRAEREMKRKHFIYAGKGKCWAVCCVCRLNVCGGSGWIIWLTPAGTNEARRTEVLNREPNNRDEKKMLLL